MDINFKISNKDVKLTKLNYTDIAQKIIVDMIVKDKDGNPIKKDGKYKINLTTSKIRNILSMISTLYNDIQRYRDKELSDDFLSRIQYLRMKIAYESGRETSVKEFVSKAKLMEFLKMVFKSKQKEDLVLFCNYFESLVAYHKYYGGND